MPRLSVPPEEKAWLNMKIPSQLKKRIQLRALECDLTIQDYVMASVHAGFGLDREAIREQHASRTEG